MPFLDFQASFKVLNFIPFANPYSLLAAGFIISLAKLEFPQFLNWLLFD